MTKKTQPKKITYQWLLRSHKCREEGTQVVHNEACDVIMNSLADIYGLLWQVQREVLNPKLSGMRNLKATTIDRELEPALNSVHQLKTNLTNLVKSANKRRK